MSSLKDKFGKRVKEIRKGKGITQEQLAESVNIEPPNISKIECGMHFPQPDKIEKIAKVLFEFEHYQDREELVNFITDTVNNCEPKTLELIYKFVYNIKLYK